ncbi:MAG TPA: FixH family protein [Geminicoccaceae bacterium]
MTSGRTIRRWLGERWVPLAFAAFCLVVLVANGTMIAIALTTWPGVETADAFRKGIAYNATLAAAREQAGLGWRADLGYEPTGRRRGRVELHLTDAAGRPVERAEVRADLVRPVHEGYDFAASFERGAASGVYALEAEFPLGGVWDVRLRIEGRQGLYQTSRRIVVPW